MAQYSNFQNFTWEALTQAKKTRENLQKKIGKVRNTSLMVQEVPNILAALAEKIPLSPFHKEGGAEQLIDQIDEAMKDNLNTPKLLSVVNNALSSPSVEELEVLYWLEEKILKVGLFDGIKSSLPPFSKGGNTHIPPEITQLANQRLQAKQEKNYALADELRAKIQEAGYVIKDTPEGFEIEQQ
jgi:cysteinyl-tRNA synthetase